MMFIEAVKLSKVEGREEYDLSTDKPLFEENSVIVTGDSNMSKLISKADPTMFDIPVADPLPTGGYDVGYYAEVTPESIARLLEHLPKAINDAADDKRSKEQLEKLQTILSKYNESSDPEKHLLCI